jgi:hypothetical protein
MPPGETAIVTKRNAGSEYQASRKIGEVGPPESLHQRMIRSCPTQSMMFEDHRANQFLAFLVDIIEIVEGSLDRRSQIVKRVVEPDPRIVKECGSSQWQRRRLVKIHLKTYKTNPLCEHGRGRRRATHQTLSDGGRTARRRPGVRWRPGHREVPTSSAHHIVSTLCPHRDLPLAERDDGITRGKAIQEPDGPALGNNHLAVRLDDE